MSETPTMKYCPHIECGGELQPHSYDTSVGGLDCDGPCSPRRVQMWKDMQATKEITPCKICVELGESGCRGCDPSYGPQCPETGLYGCGTEHCSIHGHY